MLKNTLIAIFLAIILYVFGLFSLILVSTLIILGSFVVKHINNGTITKLSTLLTMGFMLTFIVLIFLDFFGKISTTSSILVAITVIFALSWIGATDEKNYGQVMIITVLFIIFLIIAPILNAWTPILGDKAQNVNAQLGMAEKTDGMFSGVTNSLETMWMMLTDPTGYAENKDKKKGNQEGGDVALEITSVKAMPTTVMPEDEYTMVFELKNLGKNDATNVRVGARVDARAYKHGSYIDDVNVDGVDEQPSWHFMNVDTIHPHEQRFENFNIVSPGCSGTFTSRAYVEYTYNAVATSKLELITREYYDDLLQHNKLNFNDQVSEASAGPFKLTIRTQYPQPIPTTKSKLDDDDNPIPTKFKIYFTAINEREGQAYINDIAFRVPFELVHTGDCDMILKDDDKYHLNFETADKKLKNRCIEPTDMTTYSCEFEYNINDEANDFDLIKTLSLFSEINYTFTYSKSTTTTVKNNVAGYKTCSELDNDQKVEYADKLLSDGVIDKEQNKLIETKNSIITNYCIGGETLVDAIRSTDENCIVANQAAAVNAVTEFANACYGTWYGAKNDEIECGSIIIELKDGCTATQFNIESQVKGIGAETTWNNPAIDPKRAYKFNFNYVQSSCTLSGLEIDITKKSKRDCDVESEPVVLPKIEIDTNNKLMPPQGPEE